MFNSENIKCTTRYINDTLVLLEFVLFSVEFIKLNYTLHLFLLEFVKKY